MISPKILTDKEVDIIIKHVDSHYAQMQLLSSHTFALHRESKISLCLPVKDVKRLQRLSPSYGVAIGKARLENGKGFSGKLETLCFIASKNWQKLGPLGGQEVDLIDHLDKLLPRIGQSIGLFTYQNGIQNSIEDFQRMGRSIIGKLELEKPLCIGIYNKTVGVGYGILSDLERLSNEWALNVNSMLFMRQLFATLATVIPKINPHLLWTHIAHSEGASIAQGCLNPQVRSLSADQLRFLQKHLITATYGGVNPIPDAFTFDRINTYSNKDIVLRLIKKHLDKVPKPDMTYQDQELTKLSEKLHNTPLLRNQSSEEIESRFKATRDQLYNQYYIDRYPHISEKNGYTITVVDSIVESLPLIEGDHGFQGDTYQDQLGKNIQALREKWKIAI